MNFVKQARLKRNIAMVVGNGASMTFGSDSWQEMRNKLANHLSPFYVDDTESINVVRRFTLFVSRLGRKNAPLNLFYSSIYESIYGKYETKMHTQYTLVRSISSAKHKFMDMPLFTYNFDCFIEKDYH